MRLRSSVPSPEPISCTEVTPATGLAARVALQEGVRLDQPSDRAWSQLATCYISDFKNRWNEAGKEEIGAGKELVHWARKTLAEADAIDPNIAQSRYVEGFIRCVEGRHQDGYEAMDRAARLDPSFAAAHAQKAGQLVRLGRAEEALPDCALCNRARRSARPVGRRVLLGIGACLFRAERLRGRNPLAAAIGRCERQSVVQRRVSGRRYALARRVGQARDALRQFYGRGFGWYTPRRVAEIYASELPNNAACAHRELYRGLRVAETDFSQRLTAS